MGYEVRKQQEVSAREKTRIKRSWKHVIHKAIQWRKMLDDVAVRSLSEIAGKEGLTRARVTEIMNLLKLPVEMREFLLELEDAKEIRKCSERRLRTSHSGKYPLLESYPRSNE